MQAYAHDVTGKEKPLPNAAAASYRFKESYQMIRNIQLNMDCTAAI